MPRSRRIALSALAIAALFLGSGCSSTLQTTRRNRDAFSSGQYMSASDGLGRSVQSAEILDRQDRIRVANAPTE